MTSTVAPAPGADSRSPHEREGGTTVRSLVADLWEGFDTNDLMTSASALSFQALTALVPGLLFVVGLLGFLGLDSVWQDDVRPPFAEQVSPAVLRIADDTVNNVLGSQQLWWVTIGAALAAWQLSGAVRATMSVLNRIYGSKETRGWKQRYGVSVGLSVAIGLLLIVAASTVFLVPLVDGGPSTGVALLEGIGRWAVAGALTLLAVGLLVHFCPNRDQHLGWVSLGAGLVVVGWLLMSGGFFVYLTRLASYGTVFGNLATIVILLGYLYLSAVVFLGGLQLDALLRERGGEQEQGATLTEGDHARS